MRTLAALALLLLTAGRATGAEPQFATGASYATYCVRACDGYFWRHGTAAPDGFTVQEAECRAACPAAEVARFVHRLEDESELHLRFPAGTPYDASANAWTFRHRFVPDCGCR